jgi:hypothetical protein
VKRALSLLAAVVAATACAPELQTPAITLSKPEAPAPTDAGPPASSNQPKRPGALAPPGPVPEPPPATVSVPVPVTPDPSPDLVRDLRRTVVDVPSGIMAARGQVSLLSSVPRTAPSRPRLILRIADGYGQIARVCGRDPACGNIVYAARRTAIFHYQMLVNEYPQWCADANATAPAKSTGCADETLYYLALEQERDGDLTAAQGNYSLVIRDWPKSRFIPSVYLALGEMLLAESDSYPSRLSLAEQSYLKAIQYPPPDNVVYGYAQLQVGRVYLKKADRAAAMRAFRSAMAWAGAYPSAVGGGPVAAEAREALARLG